MTMYDDFGREVQETRAIGKGEPKHDIADILDRGREPDFDKDSLNGKEIVVYGIIGPEQWSLGPVYFILLKRKEDPAIDDPWGVMFPATSPVCQATLRASRQKMLPFRGVMQKTTSEQNPEYQYWEFRKR